jgi:hypothetical protein
VNTLTSSADTEALVTQDPEAMGQLIADVLRREHRKMCARQTPNGARTVLDVAHSFADELAALDPRFDRVQFIKDVTDDPS